MTDEEWAFIEPLLPTNPKRGRLRRANMREVINALRWLVRASAGWSYCPMIFRLDKRFTGGSGV